MIEQLICWFLGHVPDNRVMEISLEGNDDFSVCQCSRCKHIISFDPVYGWIKW